MKLWFENARGEERVIAECNTWEEVHTAINHFIDQCNERKHELSKAKYGKDYDPAKVVPFKSYYTRIYSNHDGRTRIDVGSHTEFFIWEGKYNANI